MQEQGVTSGQGIPVGQSPPRDNGSVGRGLAMGMLPGHGLEERQCEGLSDSDPCK